MPLSPGDRLETYEIVARLGAGGMGEVWLATDLRLQRKVAIKILPTALTQQATRVARFQREARAASALNHPNVCTIYALGETPDGHQFIVMELVEGVTLRLRLAAGRQKTPDALDLTIQVASALTAAHAAGVVHRDVKPENVIVRPDGVVKVLDFGLAKLTAPGSDDGEATRTLETKAGAVMGTVAYMSPEQARGEEVDARTDVWSLGVVLYELLAGQLPFAGRSPSDVIAAILEHDPAPLAPLAPAVPAELHRIVGKALRKDRDQRYQVMKDLQLDLEALRDNLKLAASARASSAGAMAPASLDTSVGHPARGPWKRVAVAATVVVLIALGALAVGGWWTRDLWKVRNQPPPHVTPAVLTRLTFDAGLQTDVTWSPDGRSIAYASDKAGNFDIWVQRVEGGDAVQITKSPAQDTQPTWSPDGSTIVFRSDRGGGGLFVVPASGGAERRLTSFGVQPRWAPDGSLILFASSGVLAGAVPQLYTVRLDGRPPEQVLQPFVKQLSEMNDWNWYPDSRQVSVLGRVPGQGLGVYTVPLSGGPAVLLKHTPELGSWNGFTWASSTTLFVDCGDYWRGVGKLTVDPATMRVLAADRVITGDGWETRLALSPDGRRLGFTMTKMSQRLWVLPFDATTGRVAGGGEPVTDSAAYVTTSTLSRDGTKLAYGLDLAGSERSELWTTDLATGHRLALARDDQARGSPQWSRDGTRLAYRWFRQTNDHAVEVGLAVRRTDTNEDEIISTPRNDRYVVPFDWSPDDQWVLASSGPVRSGVDGSLGLWPLVAAPHAETAVRVLTRDKDFSLWQAKFSPDGGWICFQAVNGSEAGASTIFVMPSGGADRSHWTALTGVHGWADKPRWSPDGRLVYFIQQDSFFNVWAVRFDGAGGKPVGAPFQVTRFDSPRRQISPQVGIADIGVSAHRLVLTIMEKTGNISMLDGVNP